MEKSYGDNIIPVLKREVSNQNVNKDIGEMTSIFNSSISNEDKAHKLSSMSYSNCSKIKNIDMEMFSTAEAYLGLCQYGLFLCCALL